MSNVEDDAHPSTNHGNSAKRRPVMSRDEVSHFRLKLGLHDMSPSDFKKIYRYLPNTDEMDVILTRCVARSLLLFANTMKGSLDLEIKERAKVEEEYGDYQKQGADEYHDLEAKYDALRVELKQEQKLRKNLEEEEYGYLIGNAEEQHDLEVQRETVDAKLVQERKLRRNVEEEYGEYQQESAAEHHELELERDTARERLTFCYARMTSEQQSAVERDVALSRRITAAEEETFKKMA